MSEELVLAGVAVVAKVTKNELIRRQDGKRKVHKRKVWVKPWIKRRADYGASNTLLKELKNEDLAAYRNILRITGKQFDKLLGMVDEMLLKQDTIMRMAIPVTTKLEITLRYLATGDSFKSLEYLFRVPETTISKFLPHVLTAISCVLQPFIQVNLSTTRGFTRQLVGYRASAKCSVYSTTSVLADSPAFSSWLVS
nr:unnamed protein product [Callosobruchus chinensis]